MMKEAVVLVLFWSFQVHSLPYFLLTNPRPKCIGIIASQGQTLTIQYMIPGTYGGDGALDSLLQQLVYAVVGPFFSHTLS